MSFDNHYPNRKDQRKPYRKAKACDRSCRNHGGCVWCERNRLYQDRKERQAADRQVKEFEDGKA